MCSWDSLPVLVSRKVTGRNFEEQVSILRKGSACPGHSTKRRIVCTDHGEARDELCQAWWFMPVILALGKLK